jgi:uncharacterized protein
MKYFVEILNTAKKGRGVFATKEFKAGEIVEKCPIIYISKKEDADIQKTILGRYVYEWRSDTAAIILGYGSIYNHSYNPNAEYIRDFENKIMIYKAIKPISPGEEITINYNGDPLDLKPVDDFRPIKE